MPSWFSKIRASLRVLRYVLSGLRSIILIRRSGLFDAEFYRRDYSSLGLFRRWPFTHYLLLGWRQPRNPSPLFDTRSYLHQHTDVEAHGVNPLAHYLRRGRLEGRDPHPLFAAAWYLLKYPEVAQSGKDPVLDFLHDGHRKGHSPCPEFDTAYYLSRYPDVAESGENPLVHYLTAGWRERRNPNSWFDTGYYLDRNPDILTSGFDPLSHYVICGALEGRPPNDKPLGEDSFKNALSSEHYIENFISRYATSYVQDNWKKEFEDIRDALTDRGGTKAEEILSRKISFSFPAYESISVSIIIPVYNKLSFTINCLDSILRCQEKSSFEVIVVDDGSTDNTSKCLALIPNIKVVAAGRNLGFISACNAGARHAQGEYLCFLNNDTLVTPNWLEQLVHTIRTYPACGAVGAKLVYPEGTLQEAGAMLWRDGATRGYGRNDDPSKPEYCFVRETAYCSAACLLLRRDVFERLGGFDALFEPAYYEDVDLCMRVQALGYKVVYQPGATVIHLEFSSSSTDRAVDLMRLNKSRFQDRWYRQLRFYPENALTNVLIARQAPRGKTVLFIDDRIPASEPGSGHPLGHEMLQQLVKFGYLVTLFPISDPTPYQPSLHNLQRMGVEVFHSGYADLDKLLHERVGHYDAVFLSRSDNTNHCLDQIRAAWPTSPIVRTLEALSCLHDSNLAVKPSCNHSTQGEIALS